MILEGIFNILINIASGFFSALPDITWSCDSLVYQNAISLIQGVCYLLPTDALIGIAAFVFTLMQFRIIIAILKAIKGVIPFI